MSVLYLLGAEVIAESVFVDKNKGKIIGGKIEALYKIECAFAGNNHERKTLLQRKRDRQGSNLYGNSRNG